MAFGRRALQMAIGLAAVAIGVGLFAFSEHQRERRHANRPQAIVGRLLELAHRRSSDTIYDLECGDGSVVVTAATQYGARGWCFDIYPQRLTEARERARRAGVENPITFRQQNWDAVDVTPASVVILWLTNPTGHSDYYKLRSQLTRALQPGSRIVSYWRDLGDWQPIAASIAGRAEEPDGPVKLWVADGVVRP
jgi:SAM-dependent methyltransferase